MDGRGGFYMMGANDRYNIRNIPEGHQQLNPVYKIPSRVTLAFAQAYALFISKNLVHFTKTLEEAVELDDLVVQFHCIGAVDSAHRIYNAKMSFTRVPLPGGFWSSMAWDFGGNKEKSAKLLKLYAAIPDLVTVTGTYFDGIHTEKGRRRYHSNYEENWEKICGSTIF